MKIIGITGGVGSGKSQVLNYMKERFGAKVCQADHVAWKLQEPGQKCYEEIVKHFGTDILNEDRTINRSVLGAIVFRNESELQTLNEIMHPNVKKEIERIIKTESAIGTKIFVLEAALLVEEHYDEICDELWYIKTDASTRRSRLKESRNYSDDKIDAMMASQLSDNIFEKACHRVIDNNGVFQNTSMQIDDIIKQLGV